ncbi:hypothetical protein AMTRI_Chr08g162380 [Amborella trichopoda]
MLKNLKEEMDPLLGLLGDKKLKGREGHTPKIRSIVLRLSIAKIYVLATHHLLPVAPKVELRFEILNVPANVHVGGRALLTLVNSSRDSLELRLTALRLLPSDKHSLTLLNNVSGIVKPGRMTLLLGPPASGKSTLLMALAGKLDKTTSGHITYNGESLQNFYPRRTSAYVSQIDNHIGELTIRETLDFAARCQGARGQTAGYLSDLTNLEKERKIHPSPEIDAFMKHSLATDYVMRVPGLDICADTLVGSDMDRGVSGGQKERVTTGEMVVGPRKTLFMDEISTGLDSSTTFQIVKCVGNFVHLMEGTVLMALLQPAPETFELFDDLILLSEGQIVYQGPQESVLEFFESLGFVIPLRKGVADFPQEVMSRKDQAQYWADNLRPYVFVLTSKIAEAFKESKYGKLVESNLLVPFNKANENQSALARSRYAVSKWEIFKACFARELLLISWHRFLYIFRTCQVAFVGLITCTMVLRTRIHPTDEINGNLYLPCLFFGLVHMMFNGFSDLPILISRLPVFYKQRDNLFYPAWAFSIPSLILCIPYSIVEALIWSCVVYYTVGFAPGGGRFFRFMFILFSVHQMALGLFRTIGAIGQDMVVTNTFGSFALLIMFYTIKPWWIWGYWISPLSYGQSAISINEFIAPRWMKESTFGSDTVGHNVLRSHGLPVRGYWYWLGVGVLLAYSVFFKVLSTLALKYLNVIPSDAIKGSNVEDDHSHSSGQRSNIYFVFGTSPERSTVNTNSKNGMILPFQPLSMTFIMLQLLSNVSGIFTPGVLTALVGSSGAGTYGYIRISGHPKEQKPFARISGYVEQNDIHSPQITVEESLWYLSSLCLPKEVTRERQLEFVEEVMKLVELDTLRHALVGLPGSSGLSTEQRKRLTISVELVANPSIIFMDEPTSGLDASAAAIVMRTVRNTVDTGRTVVCTIHQPSIDIFESFDELLLMKRGGQVIYGGPLGEHSQLMIKFLILNCGVHLYFYLQNSITGIPAIPHGYNPATWMLKISTQAWEQKIGQDFVSIYRNSDQYREVEGLIECLSNPVAGSEPLKFATEFPQDSTTQFKVCLWKQNLTYWRSPHYNVVLLFFSTICALIFGSVFWNIGSKRETMQDLFSVMGALYSACSFLGVNNSSSIQPIISRERTVYYREKARSCGDPIHCCSNILFCGITYFMIGFERTLVKFLLYRLFMFLTFSYFAFYGMMVVGLTSSQQLAAVVSSAFYSLWKFLSGFLAPKPMIPGWWIWFYYICPIPWTLRGIITSQLGDVDTRLVGPGFNETVKEYLEVSFGYDTGMTGISVVVLLPFILLFSKFAASIKFLNFQKRRDEMRQDNFFVFLVPWLGMGSRLGGQGCEAPQHT